MTSACNILFRGNLAIKFHHFFLVWFVLLPALFLSFMSMYTPFQFNLNCWRQFQLATLLYPFCVSLSNAILKTQLIIQYNESSSACPGSPALQLAVLHEINQLNQRHQGIIEMVEVDVCLPSISLPHCFSL
jgi:hypothetical protein